MWKLNEIQIEVFINSFIGIQPRLLVLCIVCSAFVPGLSSRKQQSLWLAKPKILTALYKKCLPTLICDSASQTMVCGLPGVPETLILRPLKLILKPLIKTLVIIGKVFPFLHGCLNFVDVAKAVMCKTLSTFLRESKQWFQVALVAVIFFSAKCY